MSEQLEVKYDEFFAELGNDNPEWAELFGTATATELLTTVKGRQMFENRMKVLRARDDGAADLRAAVDVAFPHLPPQAEPPASEGMPFGPICDGCNVNQPFEHRCHDRGNRDEKRTPTRIMVSGEAMHACCFCPECHPISPAVAPAAGEELFTRVSAIVEARKEIHQLAADNERLKGEAEAERRMLKALRAQLAAAREAANQSLGYLRDLVTHRQIDKDEASSYIEHLTAALEPALPASEGEAGPTGFVNVHSAPDARAAVTELRRQVLALMDSMSQLEFDGTVADAREEIESHFDDSVLAEIVEVTSRRTNPEPIVEA